MGRARRRVVPVPRPDGAGDAVLLRGPPEIGTRRAGVDRHGPEGVARGAAQRDDRTARGLGGARRAVGPPDSMETDGLVGAPADDAAGAAAEDGGGCPSVPVSLVLCLSSRVDSKQFG